MKRICLAICGAAGLLALLAGGCTVSPPNSPERLVVQPSGAATFANYVAIGNSLTAGFMDGALHMMGQMSSYPALLAARMGYDTAPTSMQFFQPWVADPGIGPPVDEQDPLGDYSGVMYWDGLTLQTAGPTAYADLLGLALAAAVPIPYNNLGVPGAVLKEGLTALEGGLFTLILRNPTFGNVTMVDQAIGRGPTLVTVWLGNNDVLGAALYGGPITDPTQFAADYETMISTIEDGVRTKTGFDPLIVAANIPYVTSIPFFIDAAIFAPLWPFGFEDPDAQLVRFPALQWIADPGNLGNPLPAIYTLNTVQIQGLNDAVDAFNTAIADICSPANHDITVVNARDELENLPFPQGEHMVMLALGGMDWQDAAAVTMFSLDGIHPNNRGYAFVANLFIAAINQRLGADLLQEIVLDDVPWDPTYGRPPVAAAANAGPLAPGVAEAMIGIFR